MYKKDIYERLEIICQNDSIDDMLNYLCNFFNSQELEDLLEHIKEEKGI